MTHISGEKGDICTTTYYGQDAHPLSKNMVILEAGYGRGFQKCGFFESEGGGVLIQGLMHASIEMESEVTDMSQSKLSVSCQ